MKTKNAPKDLKCKINHTFLFGNRGSQKGGGGVGVRHLGKIPKKSRFLGGVASPIYLGKNCELSKWIQVGNTSIVGKLPQPTHKKDQ